MKSNDCVRPDKEGPYNATVCYNTAIAFWLRSVQHRGKSGSDVEAKLYCQHNRCCD